MILLKTMTICYLISSLFRRQYFKSTYNIYLIRLTDVYPYQTIIIISKILRIFFKLNK